MKEKIKNDILLILNKSIDHINANDGIALKELSNHTVHNASVFQDKDSILVAVIIYAISKILYRKGNLSKKINVKIIKAKNYLDIDDYPNYRAEIKNILKQIAQIDSKLKLYIDEVIKHAEIKKGSTLYSHGISMAQAAEVLGISQWELMEYVGKTRISDIPDERIDVLKRLNNARGFFQ